MRVGVRVRVRVRVFVGACVFARVFRRVPQHECARYLRVVFFILTSDEMEPDEFSEESV